MNSPPEDGSFPSTSWTLIGRIQSGDEAEACKALDEICTQYHYPLYCYLRRRGCNHHDAEDVLHDFLAKLLRQRTLERVERTRGRLRGYLSASIGNHLISRHRSAASRRQAPSTRALSLDFNAVRDRYLAESFSDAETPDRIFERKWALEMLQHTIDRLAETYRRKNRCRLFEILRPVIECGGSLRGNDSKVLADRAGMSEAALRTNLSRLLKEFRETLRAEVRQTVEHPDDVPNEIAYLMGLFQD